MSSALKAVEQKVPTIPDWVREEPTQAIIQAAQAYLDVTPAILQGTPKNIVNQSEYWRFPWSEPDAWTPDIQNPQYNLEMAAAYIVVAVERFEGELKSMADSLGVSLEELGMKIAGGDL